jgi:transposase
MVKLISKSKRDSIISLLQNNVSIRDIAISQKVSKSTVHRISKDVERPKQKGRRPRKLSERDIDYCVTQITTGRARTATELAKILKVQYNISVSQQTVARALKEKGLKAKEKIPKPLLRKKNIKDRLSFAKAHQHWTVADWRQVIYSDETKINRFSSDGRKWSWGRDQSTLNQLNVKQTVKHGGGNVKLWGCMTALGMGDMCKIDTILDSQLYLEILKGELKDTIADYQLDESKFIFQHDNDPKHTAKIIKEYLNTQEYQTMVWPSQSPDLNPIEHIWSHIKSELNKYPQPASGMLELWERIQEVKLTVTKEICLNLIDSMPRRMQAVIKAKGRWTRY